MPDTSAQVFFLFVTGRDDRTDDLESMVRKVGRQCFADDFHLETIDVLSYSEWAGGQVLATPALVRMNPGPKRHLIGDFNNENDVLREMQASELQLVEGNRHGEDTR